MGGALMLDAMKINIEDMVVHKVGNKLKDEGIVISKNNVLEMTSTLKEILLKYFLSSFKNETYFKFSHETDLFLNEVYYYVSDIFKEKENFYNNSVNILKHLYENSTHPKIKSGELYVVYFSNCYLEGKVMDAIGIFKSENKDIYLKVLENNNYFDMDFEKGINIKELDKGCIIFNTENESGFKVTIVDKTSSSEAMYWKSDFLGLMDYKDENYHTTTYLNICNHFVKELTKDNEHVDATERIAFLNKTLDYFSENDEFNFETFANDVIKEPERIEQFKSIKQGYIEKNEIETLDHFDISNQALKKIKRKINNLIKLDTDVEIKINCNNKVENSFENIEKGFDNAKGMYYYKIYYNTEKGM